MAFTLPLWELPLELKNRCCLQLCRQNDRQSIADPALPRSERQPVGPVDDDHLKLLRPPQGPSRSCAPCR